MKRNKTVSGIVLKKYPVGEIHAGVMLLTKEEGIISAIAHGVNAKKSRLKALTNPFCIGAFSLYHNPVKDSFKITDVDIYSYGENLQTSLPVYYTACLFLEVCLKSHAAGVNSAAVFSLLRESLQVLETEGEKLVSRLLPLFIWRYVILLGLEPDLTQCVSCGHDLSGEGAYADRSGVEFSCRNCTSHKEFFLSSGAIIYLRKIRSVPFEEALAIGLDESSFLDLKRYLFHLIQISLDERLNTLKIAGGII